MVIPCTLCGKPTPMLSTKLCDRCWELKTRIVYDLELAKRIIDEEAQRRSSHSEGLGNEHDN